eukprot:12919956-Prorocentrum_lima.AAC.1
MWLLRAGQRDRARLGCDCTQTSRYWMCPQLSTSDLSLQPNTPTNNAWLPPPTSHCQAPLTSTRATPPFSAR